MSLVLAACSGGAKGDGDEPKGGGGAGSQPPANNAKPIASAPASIGKGKARVDVLSVSRSTNNTATVRVNLVDEGSESAFNVGNMMTDPVEQNDEANGITFVDGAAGKRYYPLRTTDGKCLCSDTSRAKVEPGKPTEIYATLPAPPANVKRVTLGIPMAGAFPDIPISDGPAPPVPGATVDPSSAQLQPPKILPLVSTVEGDTKAVDDDGTEEKVRLSTDVLFALNKANINPRAKSVLSDVAKRIDQSPGNTVKVDGHADNTGNDAINDPLSQRRAESVVQELKGIVTRKNLTYQPAGHGSKEPIADNSTAQGRQRNRRVTVSFTKPAPPKPSAPPASAAPSSPGGVQQVLATAKPKESDVQNLKAEITSFKRDSSGLVTMLWRVTNNGSEKFYAGTRFRRTVTEVLYFKAYGTSGVTLRDEPTASRTYTLRDQSGSCVCTGMTSYASKLFIAQNEGTTYFNVFKLPPEQKSINVELPGYEVVENVQIS